MHHCNWIDFYDFLCMDAYCYAVTSQLTNKTTAALTMRKTMLRLVQLRFDTEEDMSFCRCMKCGEEGQDVAEIGSEFIGALQESNNWKWNGPYFDDQSFVETLYPSKMYRPCAAQSSRKSTGQMLIIYLLFCSYTCSTQSEDIPIIVERTYDTFCHHKVKVFPKKLFGKGHQSKSNIQANALLKDVFLHS